jgi:diacylglycerol kinase family enzyme
MTVPLPVLINPSGGMAAALGERLESRVHAAFAATGRDISLQLLTGDDLVRAVRRHADCPVVAVGGGDGTVARAAQALAGTRTALGILPLGTRNHLACTLDIPLDLDEASGVAATGERRRIDLGRVGNRVFIDSASIGIHPALASQRNRGGRSKRLGTLPAAWRILRTMRPDHYRLRVDEGPRSVRTPVLLVANSGHWSDFDSRDDLEPMQEGALSLRTVPAEGRVRLAWFALKVLVGLASPEPDFADIAEARSITIEGTGELDVALDGELERMSLPLRLDILPSALGVVGRRVPAVRASLLSRIH